MSWWRFKLPAFPRPHVRSDATPVTSTPPFAQGRCQSPNSGVGPAHVPAAPPGWSHSPLLTHCCPAGPLRADPGHRAWPPALPLLCDLCSPSGTSAAYARLGVPLMRHVRAQPSLSVTCRRTQRSWESLYWHTNETRAPTTWTCEVPRGRDPEESLLGVHWGAAGTEVMEVRSAGVGPGCWPDGLAGSAPSPPSALPRGARSFLPPDLHGQLKLFLQSPPVVPLSLAEVFSFGGVEC